MLSRLKERIFDRKILYFISKEKLTNINSTVTQRPDRVLLYYFKYLGKRSKSV